MYRLLFNCIKNKNVLWNKGVKAQPYVMLTSKILNIFLVDVRYPKNFGQPVGIKAIEDVYQNPTFTSFKMIVTIVAGAWEVDAEKCLCKLETLLNIWFVIEYFCIVSLIVWFDFM